MMNINILIIISILLPVLSAVLVLFITNKVLRNFCLLMLAFTGTIVSALIVISYYFSGISVQDFKLFHLYNDLYFTLQIEPFTLLFSTLVSILWPLTLVYTINYMASYENNPKTLQLKTFYIFLCLSIAATLGIAFSGNLLTTFLFYECLTLTTYPLVIFEKTEAARKAGRKYLTILLSTSMTLFLPAIILVYIYAGSVSFAFKGLFFASSQITTTIIFLMFLFGVSKAALAPFHGWLPAAMVAPSPVSAILHAVAVVKSGVFILIKICVYTFGFQYLNSNVQEVFGINIYLFIPAITILLASTINLFQTNFKLLLAYSTISNLSYILSCVLLFNTIGLIAAAAWFIAHSLAKIVLFFQAGCYIKFVNKLSIYELSGIGQEQHLPIITTIGAFSMFSIMNLPFTLGFVAKFYLVKTIIANESYAMLVVLSISYVFTVIYFSRALYHFYFAPPYQISVSPPKAGYTTSEDSLGLFTVVMLIIAMLNMLLFFTYDSLIDITKTIIV